MKIIPLVTLQLPPQDNHPRYAQPGVEIDLAKDVARDLIARGFALAAAAANSTDQPAA